MKKITFLLLFLVFCQTVALSQEKPRFDADVKAIKKYDKIYIPNSNPIVFIGSSSIRKWNDLQTVFGKYNVLNRGIGGTVIDEIIFYLEDILFVYQPRQIVIYVGENDIPAAEKTPEIILEKTIALFKAIRIKLPETPIIYISLKPSPVRDKYMDKCIATNKLIRKFVENEKNSSFVDVFTPMLREGKSRPELFLEDMLHMKQEGYRIWEKLVKPKLLKPNN